MSTVDPEHQEEEDALAAADDEDTGAPVAPMVKLEEEIEAYRFDKERSQWKERRWYRQVSEASVPTISFCQICPRGRMLKICILLLMTPLALLSLTSPCMTNQQTSTVSMLDYSQVFSATYFEGRSSLQDHFGLDKFCDFVFIYSHITKKQIWE